MGGNFSERNRGETVGGASEREERSWQLKGDVRFDCSVKLRLPSLGGFKQAPALENKTWGER